MPLHPPVLSEDAASLLPDGPRAAVLWRIDLDGAGEPVSVDVRRAVVRSRARLDYAGVQAAVDAGAIHPAIAALPEVGPLRRALAVRRGAIELELPEQEVVRAADGGWTVQVRRRTPVEDWNAEISLLTGTSAARIMLDAGIGVLRTLPAADPDAVDALRAVARGLGIDWPDGRDARRAAVRAAPRHARGAGPAPGRDVAAPRRRLHRVRHRRRRPAARRCRDTPGIGGPYAHVTAPLRRLVDRFGTELCLAVTAGAEVPEWLRAALPTLPETMAASDAVANAVTRACVDRTEAALLADRVGPTSTRWCCGRRPTTRQGRCTCSIRPCWPAAPARGGRGRRPGCGSWRPTR